MKTSLVLSVVWIFTRFECSVYIFTRFECSFSDEFFLLRFDRAAVQAALSVLATDGNVEGVDEDGIEAAFEPVLQDGVKKE